MVEYWILETVVNMPATGHLQLEPFDPDSGSWTEWEELLHFLLESSGITDESRKKAALLTVYGKKDIRSSEA